MEVLSVGGEASVELGNEILAFYVVACVGSEVSE